MLPFFWHERKRKGQHWVGGTEWCGMERSWTAALVSACMQLKGLSKGGHKGEMGLPNKWWMNWYTSFCMRWIDRRVTAEGNSQPWEEIKMRIEGCYFWMREGGCAREKEGVLIKWRGGRSMFHATEEEASGANWLRKTLCVAVIFAWWQWAVAGIGERSTRVLREGELVDTIILPCRG